MTHHIFHILATQTMLFLMACNSMYEALIYDLLSYCISHFLMGDVLGSRTYPGCTLPEKRMDGLHSSTKIFAKFKGHYCCGFH